jgi:hypothetical protein
MTQWILVLGLVLDIGSVKTEPNLEKRSEMALVYANSALDAARNAYNNGDLDSVKSELSEVGDSVDVAYEALSDTGKDPRKDKFFKRAEMSTRELLRRLEGLTDTVSFSDRGLVERVRDRVSAIHDNLLNGVMSKKKKVQ